MDYLIVVDMQNDFIDGSLGTKEAQAIIPAVKAKIEGFDGQIIFTKDTHEDNYLETREGRFLPVPHCIRGTKGHEISRELDTEGKIILEKPTFGSTKLAKILEGLNEKEKIGKITLIGLCTDICVISNALLIKACLPETDIEVDSACCAGVTPEKHEAALETMRSCQITVI